MVYLGCSVITIHQMAGRDVARISLFIISPSIFFFTFYLFLDCVYVSVLAEVEVLLKLCK